LRRAVRERVRGNRRRILILSGSVLLLVAAGLTWFVTRPSAEETWQLARSNIRIARTASIEIAATIGGDAQGPGQVLTGSGVIDQGAHLAEITYDFSALPGNQGGAFGALERVGTIYEDGRFLLAFPQLGRFLERDEPWVAFDHEAVGLALGADIGQLRTLTTLDPFFLISLLEGASHRAFVEGTEPPVVRFDIDVAVAAAGAPDPLADLYDLLLAESPDESASGEIFVDGETTQVTIRQGAPIAPGLLQTVEIVLLIEGRGSVDIATPAEDQVVTLQNLIDRPGARSD